MRRLRLRCRGDLRPRRAGAGLDAGRLRGGQRRAELPPRRGPAGELDLRFVAHRPRRWGLALRCRGAAPSLGLEAATHSASTAVTRAGSAWRRPRARWIASARRASPAPGDPRWSIARDFVRMARRVAGPAHRVGVGRGAGGHATARRSRARRAHRFSAGGVLVRGRSPLRRFRPPESSAWSAHRFVRGAALATKLPAVFLAIVVAGWVVWARGRQGLREVAVMGLLACIVAIAVNPNAWVDPLHKLETWIRLSTTRKDFHPIRSFYFGRTYSFHPPWHYPWVELFATMPLECSRWP